MNIDAFYQRRLTNQPLAWLDYQPCHLWIVVLGLELHLDWRPRHAPEPSVFDGTPFAPKKPRGKLV